MHVGEGLRASESQKKSDILLSQLIRVLTRGMLSNTPMSHNRELSMHTILKNLYFGIWAVIGASTNTILGKIAITILAQGLWARQ